jgi:hypothetical protein
VVQDNVHRARFAGSQFFSVHGPRVREHPRDRERARHIQADQVSSAAVRIPPAPRVPVVIRRAQEWEAQERVELRHQREDQHVRAGQRAVQDSLLFREKKKAR